VTQIEPVESKMIEAWITETLKRDRLMTYLHLSKCNNGDYYFVL